MAWYEDGRVPPRPTVRFRDRDLIEVRTRVAAQTPGEIVVKDDMATTKVPGQIIERYSPGIPVWGSLSHENWYTFSGPRELPPGKPVVERWNVGPFGPGMTPDANWRFGLRSGNWLGFEVPMFSDQSARRLGISRYDAASTRLLHNGTVLGETDQPAAGGFWGKPGAGTYRLETTVDRSNSPFSTRQSAAWTFRSERPGEGKVETLPLMAVRYAPRLDDLNQAPSGVPFRLPVYVQRQAGGKYGTLTSLTVKVSYDDGTTWHRAPVTGNGLHRVVRLTHHRDAEFVSLQATATDSLGNKVEQTVIHAYKLH